MPYFVTINQYGMPGSHGTPEEIGTRFDSLEKIQAWCRAIIQNDDPTWPCPQSGSYVEEKYAGSVFRVWQPGMWFDVYPIVVIDGEETTDEPRCRYSDGPRNGLAREYF